jgi:general secretion pathway protein G
MKKKGFTLIELLIVVALIGILAAVVAMNVGGNTDPPKWNLSRTLLLKLKGHVELFKLEQNRYPEALDELVARRYLDEVPRDGWGREFVYRVPGQRRAPFDLICFGADGVPGGAGPDEDIWSHPPRP